MNTPLFTPGPLTTSPSVRQAMLHDMGSRTPAMEALTLEVRDGLAQAAGCGDAYQVVLMQGSGTYAVEAMLSTLVGDRDRVLVVANGPYGERMAQICRVHGLNHTLLQLPLTEPVSPEAIASALDRDASITQIALVHFETALGVLNDLDAAVELAARRGIRLLVDAMSSFGALPVRFDPGVVTAVAASANKCLHGAPGVAFVIAEREALQSAGPARTLSLDLAAQHRAFETTRQWRFTPPTHVVRALAQALREHRAEGGCSARLRRYQRIETIVTSGMAAHGILPLIAQPYRAAIIGTFVLPVDEEVLPAAELAKRLLAHDLVIYPSSWPEHNSFRAGFIGELSEADARRLAEHTGRILAQARQANRRPAYATAER